MIVKIIKIYLGLSLVSLCIWNSKLYSRFLMYAFWYLLSILYLYFLYNFCDFVCFCLFVCFPSLSFSFGISYQFCTYIFFIIFVTLFVFVCLLFLSFFSFFLPLTSYFWNSKLYSRLNFCFYVFVTNFVPLRTQSSVPIFH